MKRFYASLFPDIPVEKFKSTASTAGKRAATADAAYTCDYGTTSYAPSFDSSVSYVVVFVSPSLLSEIREQVLALQHLRDACNDLIDAYNTQVGIFTKHDNVSITGQALASMRLGIEIEEYNRAKVGQRQLEKAEADVNYVPLGTSAATAVGLNAGRAASYADELRNAYKKQVLTIDYRARFHDANQAIEKGLRDLDRELFVLDRSVVREPKGRRRAGAYVDLHLSRKVL